MTKNKMEFAIITALLSVLLGSHGFAAEKNFKDMLLKLKPGAMQSFLQTTQALGKKNQIEVLNDSWVRVQLPESKLQTLVAQSEVEYVQPNYKIRLLESYKLEDGLRRAALLKAATHKGYNIGVLAAPDNPSIPDAPSANSGSDPLFAKQWGMIDANVKDAWNVTKGDPTMIVAVIDTGVDYTHEDLLPNIWRNPGEAGMDASGKNKATNGVDDDGNGFIDDQVGWDFVSDDNKPYDLSVDPIELLFGGGNPGHGTHCAGNVAARGDNGIGIAGVAPNVKIMVMRFLSEKGQGDTAGAIKSIDYAVKMGAKVLSNSWGSIGEDPKEEVSNKALRDSITNAGNQGVLFVAAVGNGKNGYGYNNDTDSEPAYPASYDHENILSVAALDVKGQLGSFSNWGARSVDIGAPGVAVFSTMVGGKYSDKVIDYGGIVATWDGTSMATPHVAGAAALYWSAHPEKTWKEVKDAIMMSATKVPSLAGKAVTEGKLNVSALMKMQ